MRPLTAIKRILIWSLALIAAASAFAPPAVPPITRLSLHIPAGVAEIHATGANDHGQVVGWYSDGQDNTQSFLRQNGVFTPITPPKDARYVQARDINNRGQIVGSYEREADDLLQSFLWHKGVWTALKHPDAAHWGTVAEGIKDSGQIVGSAVYRLGPARHTPPTPHGFLWEHGTWRTIDPPGIGAGGTKLHGINNQGQIVGSSGDEWEHGRRRPHIGFLLDHVVLTILHGPTGAAGCEPSLIGGRGLIWGISTDTTGRPKYFLWDHEVYLQGEDLHKRLDLPRKHDHVDTLLTGSGTIVEVLWNK